MILWIRSLHFLKKNFHRKLRICVFNVYQTSFILKTMKLLRFRSVATQIFKMNTSWCLLGCSWESFSNFDQFPIDLHFITYFITYMIRIRIFTIGLQLKRLSLKAIIVASGHISKQVYGIRYLIPYPWS